MLKGSIMPLTRPDTTVPGKSISPTLGGGPFSTGGRGNGPGEGFL